MRNSSFIFGIALAFAQTGVQRFRTSHFWNNWKLTYTTEHPIIAFASDRRTSKPFEFQGVDFETEERVSTDRLIC